MGWFWKWFDRVGRVELLFSLIGGLMSPAAVEFLFHTDLNVFGDALFGLLGGLLAFGIIVAVRHLLGIRDYRQIFVKDQSAKAGVSAKLSMTVNRADGSDRIELLHALAYAVHGEWTATSATAGEHVTPAFKALQTVLQAARDGAIRTWGQKTPGDIFHPIEADYWGNFTIDPMQLWEPTTSTKPRFGGGGDAQTMANIQVSRAEIEQLFKDGPVQPTLA